MMNDVGLAEIGCPAPVPGVLAPQTEVALCFDSLSKNAGLAMFATGPHAVPVALRRAPGARVLWLNQGAMANDPAFTALGGDVAAYCEHLVESCGYVVPEESVAPVDKDDDTRVTGYADRYGGAGIGTNGGSGRTALVNGYLVKGVGKTPLIGAKADLSHASGGAYLEECVRETIFSEIIGVEFPHSAIPTLAIIDTDIVQVWQLDSGQKREKRVLLVRPCLLRPAHFERAAGYLSANPKEGALDFNRVQHVFDSAAALCGKQQLKEQFARFLTQWAQQLAYAYVHRLSPGGNPTSNICLDAKLLDFGACSALPSWAQIVMIQGSLPTGNEFITLAQSAHSLGYFFGRCHDPEMGQGTYLNQVIQDAGAVYLQTLSVEVLRLCGLPRHIAQAGADGAVQGKKIHAVLRRVFAHYRKERFDILDFTPSPAVKWNLADVWLETPPFHLAELRTLLDELNVDAAPGVAPQRCRFISRTRPGLYREELKYSLYPKLEKTPLPGETEQDAISRVICSAVAGARRDVRFEVDDAVALGFGVSAKFSLAMYRCTRSGAQFAVIEWETDGLFSALGSASPDIYSQDRAGCLALQSWDEGSVTLGKRHAVRVACVVRAWP